MKLIVLALALSASGVFGARTAEETSALTLECGSLGVMEVPEGADASAYRHCAGHPLGAVKSQFPPHSLEPTDMKRSNPQDVKAADIFGRSAQACEWNSSGGCSGGYCWKACGSPGEWCWTAKGDGGGDWNRCSSYNDCKSSANCGKGCKPGNKSCGCSC